MTPSGPDEVITAADLLFGSTEGAHEALTRHVMSAGRTTARAFERLPRVTREAAVREAAAVAVGLLKIDLMEVLVSGWREHRDIFTAARRTLDIPGSKELVGLAPHRITTVQQPSVGILVDNHRVHTLQLGLSIFFEVTGLVAGVHAGRLAAIHAGRGDLGVALTIHELEVLTNRTHLELPGVKSLQRGFRLLPANAYPDESHGHPGGHPSGAALPTAVTAAAHFPGVDLMDGHVPATDLNAAGPASWSDAAEHPSSAESDHPYASWWENPTPPAPAPPPPLAHPYPTCPSPRRFHDHGRNRAICQNCHDVASGRGPVPAPRHARPGSRRRGGGRTGTSRPRPRTRSPRAPP
jgi:hypothetical protein